MKIEYIDMKDLSDSREIMQQKAPKSIRLFISIISALLIVAILWAMIGRMDNYVKASGEIRPAEVSHQVTAMLSGKIEEKYFEDNEKVEKGDVLFKIDCAYYLSQKDLLQQQIDENLSRIDGYEKLITAIEKDVNLFDEKEERIFFLEYERYASERDSALKSAASSRGQTTMSLSEIEKSITDSQDTIKELNASIAEYQKLYTAIEKGMQFQSNDSLIQETYNNYILSYDKAVAVYKQYKSAYDTLKSQTGVTEAQLQQALYPMETAEADMKLVKSNVLLSINETIRSLKREKESHESNIETCETKKAAVAPGDTKSKAKKSVKNSYYISINGTLESIKQENINLNSQLLEVEESIKSAEIIAEQSGTLLLNGDYNVGDTVNAGTVFAYVIPKTSELSVTVYIPEYSIADVKEGQKVEYRFSSISSTDFGKIYGEITEISADSFLNEENGEKYYKATATLDKTTLSNKEETKELKVGMLAEIRALTGSQTILSWLLDKLNFK